MKRLPPLVSFALLLLATTGVGPCGTENLGSRGSGLAGSCTYDGVPYANGDSFPSSDGCNICVCEQGATTCTARACVSGGEPPAPVDGGPSSSWRSFDIVAVPSVAPGAFQDPRWVPQTNRFTLVLDADKGRMIVGGSGTGKVVNVTSADGQTFRTSETFDVRDVVDECGRGTVLTYDSLEITVNGSALSGTATGTINTRCGGLCTGSAPFTASIQGEDDVTPPYLLPTGLLPSPANIDLDRPPQTDVTVRPFAPLVFRTSEPLPMTATTLLTASDGSVPFVPVVVDGDPSLIVGFTRPNAVPNSDQAFSTRFDGLIDFAQNAGTSQTLSMGSWADPPLVPQDGFESASGATLGGAAVLTEGAIAGTRSLFIGTLSTPALGKVTPGRTLLVRLALHPGDKKLLFSYQIVGESFGGVSFSGSVSIGSVGHRPADTVTFPVAEINSGPSGRGRFPGANQFTTDTQEMKVPLPLDLGDELVVEIGNPTAFCGVDFTPYGLIVDDLRLE